MSDPFEDWESAFDAGIEPVIPTSKTSKKASENIWLEANKEGVHKVDVYLENQDRTFYRPELKVLSRKDNSDNSGHGSGGTTNLNAAGPNGRASFDKKKLEQKMKEYQKARDKIFNED
ncbi:hypothetical protein AYI69_g6111 [Smittium culicis]|uniref:SUZ domain-containing protein n=1 Tax=Smittium culicis TaxID=133412 RepID=A0A1R1Y137_9FUNG|nr:hypothetical protein AYI69_g6111 [Smittium culicis]